LLLGVHLLHFGDTLLKTGSIGLQPGNPIIGLCASSFNLLEEQTCLRSQGGSLAGGWKISLKARHQRFKVAHKGLEVGGWRALVSLILGYDVVLNLADDVVFL
jgi:hypothetical protein